VTATDGFLRGGLRAVDALNALATALGTDDRNTMIAALDDWLAFPARTRVGYIYNNQDSISSQDNLERQELSHGNISTVAAQQSLLLDNASSQGTILASSKLDAQMLQKARKPKQLAMDKRTKAEIAADELREQLVPVVAPRLKAQSFSDWWRRGNRANTARILATDMKPSHLVAAVAAFIDERGYAPQMTYMPAFIEQYRAKMYRKPFPTKDRPFPMSEGEFIDSYRENFRQHPRDNPEHAKAMRRIWENEPE
jgi:hypothetical protein